MTPNVLARFRGLIIGTAAVSAVFLILYGCAHVVTADPQAPAAPMIIVATLSPASGTVGTPVTIAGTNFGTTQGSSTVTFNGTAATATT
jgi:hypothetical protein